MDLRSRHEAWMASDARPWSSPVQRQLDEAGRRAFDALGYAGGEDEHR